MLVKCVYEVSDGLRPTTRAALQLVTSGHHWPVEVGRLYVVYAISVVHGVPGYYISPPEPEEDWDYPRWIPAALFEVTDPRIPSGMVVETDSPDGGNFALLPEEWLSIEEFYDLLTDGEDTARKVWRDLRQRIDREAGVLQRHLTGRDIPEPEGEMG